MKLTNVQLDTALVLGTMITVCSTTPVLQSKPANPQQLSVCQITFVRADNAQYELPQLRACLRWRTLQSILQ